MDLRALVVCPDQDSNSLLTLILDELGITVEHSPSISRGLELLDGHHFDAIVFDYRGDQSSEEFLSRLRQSARSRVTMLIAVVDSEFNARPVFGLGANFVLYRPLSAERVRISLRAARGLMSRERRRAPRKVVNSTASIAFPGAPETSAVLANLSESGTLLHTANHLPLAVKIYFEFALPGERQLVRLSGEVAWQDASGRIGIRFLDLPQSSRRLIKTWLRQNSARPNALTALPSKPAPLDSEGTEFRDQVAHVNPGRIGDAGNRRGERRFACKLGAEVYSLGSGVPNYCTLSDISEGGCYVEMPSPVSCELGVEILVRTVGTKLRITGQVISNHPGFGMGVRFMFRDSAEREEVLRLLAALAIGPSLDEQLP